MLYEFGIMSKKWSIDAIDEITALVTICLFIGKNIPVAIYSPISKAFMPIDILRNYQDRFESQNVRDSIKTIKELM